MATYAAMVAHSNHSIVMMKATGDPNTDGNWGTIDSDIYLGQKTTIKSLWSFEDSSDIHVATQELNGRVSYHVFDPGTDTWTVRNEFVVEPGTDFDNAPAFHAVSLALRSDGDVILVAAYNEASGETLRLFRRESGSWTNQANAGNNADDQGVVVIGPHTDDRITWVFSDDVDGTPNVFLRSINSSNTVCSGNTQIDPTPDTSEMIVIPGVVDSGSSHYLGHIDASNKITVTSFTPACPPTGITTHADVSDNTVKGHGAAAIPFAVACLAVDGTDVHLLYADDATQDIFHDDDVDGGGTTDDEVKDGVTCNRLSANIYDRSGKKLAYLYLDGTTSKYAEVALEAPAGPPKGGLALLGVGA